MRFAELACEALLVLLVSSCGGPSITCLLHPSMCVATAASGCTANSDSPAVPPPSGSGNYMEVTVNGSLCGPRSGQYPNEPCAEVTICVPGTSTCQTIDNILLDTGSYGLRIFRSAVTIPLINTASGGPTVGDCVHFGDGSSEWGPVALADVGLGGEKAPNVPIELIDQSFATPPALCKAPESIPDTSPAEAGFNGVLGVGVLSQDKGQYYACSGSSCSPTAVSPSQQVQNPVGLLPTDNNGIILELPQLSNQCGVASATGYLLFGVGTQSNNKLTGLTYLPTDANGDVSTVFSSYGASSMPGFFDSGSTFLVFPAPSDLGDCSSYGSVYQQLYCPSSTGNFSADNSGLNGLGSSSVDFEIANGYDRINSGNFVFDNVGQKPKVPTFDWGLPFFYGKRVVFGIEGKASYLGTGPYYAY